MSKKITTEIFIERSKQVHGDKYDYSKVIYTNNRTNIIITCKIHGDFLQNPANHMLGKGCKKCANDNLFLSSDNVINNIIEKYGDNYDYSKAKYVNSQSMIEIGCHKHGFFKKNYWGHMRSKGCPKCIQNIKLNKFNSNFNNIVIEKDSIYSYSKVVYKGSKQKIEIVCPKHGSFWQTPNNHLSKNQNCPKCMNYGSSNKEIELFNFINIYKNNTTQSNKNILGRKEIDIYIPELKIGIEYNGLYWHSDLYKNRLYHLNKLKLANSNNIKLIQIFEDEWMYKQDIVKSRLLNIIGKTPNKLYARKCEIREVESKDSSNFLDQNHIQGKLGAKVKLGLYYDNELVSLMTFGNLRKNLGSTSKEGSYELLRFCNKLNTTVIGGASKLFKYFITNYNPINIISYADRRWSEGNLYYNLGFKLLGETKPNYFYVNKYFLNRESRFKYRKDILIKNGFDPNKSEYEIMKDNGYTRIYDCGVLKFEYKSN